jgi:hypothetical protein
VSKLKPAENIRPDVHERFERIRTRAEERAAAENAALGPRRDQAATFKWRTAYAKRGDATPRKHGGAT